MDSNISRKTVSNFGRTNNGSAQKDTSQRSLFLQCPICNKNILRTLIEEHVESCLSIQQISVTNTQNDQPRTDETKIDADASCSHAKFQISDSTQLITPTINQDDGLHENQRNTESSDGRLPLAERMRPLNFDDISGNDELFGKGSVVRSLLEKDPPPSIILFGPPGCGKTTVASVIKVNTKCPYHSLSCCTASVSDIKEIALHADNEYRLRGLPTILFMDEIHRFNKKQQDIFLPFVERGTLILLGATTENPSFAINSALLSRCHVLPMKLLSVSDICNIIHRAIKDDKIVNESGMRLSDDVISDIAQRADGDARIALNSVETCCLFVENAIEKLADVIHFDHRNVSIDMVKQIFNDRFVRYDRHGEEHFNIISALHKSIRGSDVQASLYWLSRMLEGGEDPLYISRRLIRCSTEDVGLSDPQALTVTTKCYQACKDLGSPECYPILTQCVSYLALTSKSNELYLAYGRINDVIHEYTNPSVPVDYRLPEVVEFIPGKTWLPEKYRDNPFFDTTRAISDLREMSINRYLNPIEGDTIEKETDPNQRELPFEKRIKICCKLSSDLHQKDIVEENVS